MSAIFNNYHDFFCVLNDLLSMVEAALSPKIFTDFCILVQSTKIRNGALAWVVDPSETNINTKGRKLYCFSTRCRHANKLLYSNESEDIRASDGVTE